MCADLGQVQYVLSDKTGTLTQNSMKLRRCSLVNKVYGAPVLVPGSDEPSISRGTELRHSSIQKVIIGEQWDELDKLASLPSDSSQIGEDFLRVLAACNTVMLMPDVLTGKLDIQNFKDLEKSLQAESPDEVALALAVGEYANLLLIERSSNLIATRNGAGKIERMNVLAVNEFESNRKRMSVLVKFEDSNKYMLLCKGADTSTLDRCVNSQYTSSCTRHIDQFARTGLRTLVLARRVLSEKDASVYLTNYRLAANSIGHREEMLARCADEMEIGMELLGAVGIEDQLQEGVPESISMLQRMGLNVWMITGDKAETAEAISRMCCLLRSDHRILRLVGLRGEELRRQLSDVKAIVLETKAANRNRLQELNLLNEDDTSVVDTVWKRLGSMFRGNKPSSDEASDNAEPPERKSSTVSISSNNISPLALIVDGSSLEAIWAVPELVMGFTEITRDIATVIACRVSPLQKASLVRMVKRDPMQPVTLAIGDGANDVGMIHEAKVGVGINGKEGKHASNSADFALGQFRFLVPLLLEHGRFNYIRCSNLVLYSFFKNLVLVSCLFYFCIYSGFSGSMPIDSIVIGGFNFYLGIPIILLGAFDWDVHKETVRRHPFLAYATGRLGEMLNMSNMFFRCVLAFLEGLIIFAVVVRCIAGELSVRPSREQIYDIDGVGLNDEQGRGGGIYAEGFLLLSCIIMSMQTKVLFMGTTTNWIMLVWWLISILGFYMFNLLYSQFPSLEWYQIVAFTMKLRVYWLAFFIVPVIITITDYIVEYVYGKFILFDSQLIYMIFSYVYTPPILC
jgi:phospholipid-transporting ATPase